ncbi:alpha/beta hydrolase [Nocardia goodfellowii]|uniref:Alpha-beta hydrolase superfamily lysophospholipase n=1 Tax=Nocardia goodfellowii TaxID=882446 RepID=A0ABS4QCC6_9NOCA|nr:alpha/beta hydrolase [Nocardia goodfellowii]MBP2189359.1 alpha-beta hydrolase superfamily lysophospholipase [Nocardia goodfellowii]
MPFFDGVRGRLHYRRWPVDQPAAALVLLPGIGQHTGHYHRFAKTVRAAGFEMWALDTAGHGLSEGTPESPGTPAELVADALRLIELVRAEAPGAPLLLMGHSLGAVTVLGLLGAAVPKNASGMDISTVAARWPLVPSVEPTALAGLVLSGVPERALGGGFPGGLGTPLPRGLPILAVHGVDDRRAPIDAIRDWTDRHNWVSLFEYDDAGHDLLHEPVHARVAADIAQWMREVVAPAGVAGRHDGAVTT